MRADSAAIIQLKVNRNLSKSANRIRRKKRILRRYYTGSRNIYFNSKPIINPV